MNYIQAQRFAFQHECAECGNSPSLYPSEKGGYDVRCQNRNHQGFTKLKSYIQRWKEGDALPIQVANKIQQKEEKRGWKKGKQA